jgi:hypothetical protein
MAPRLARAALPIAVIGCGLWFLIAMTQADAPRALVQSIAVGIALYILLREGCRPLKQMRRPVSWRHR